MPDLQLDPHAKLNVREAAVYLRVSKSFLDKLRVTGGGPPYIKVGAKRVVYDPADLATWLADRKRVSTSGAPHSSGRLTGVSQITLR
jgi:predicted DNA-binding transcriptional regulator AlpA